MAEPHVVTALIRKRAEIAGQIEHTQTQLRQLVIDLDNLDATLRLFKPDIDLEEIRPKPLPPRHHAFKGEVSRIVLDTLEATGIHETERNINNKISRGGFSATFFVQCLTVIGCHTLHLEDS